MTANLTLALAGGILVAAGVTLVLERALTRILIGFILLGNGVNVLFLVAAGPAGSPPLVGQSDEASMADALPQAMVLTAIVIMLGVVAFGLALAYRSWQLTGNDEVQDDVEDAYIRRLAHLQEASSTFDESVGGELEEEGADEPDDEHSGARSADDRQDSDL